MSKFYIHIPGWVYAMTAYGTSKVDAVRRFKQQHGMARMPRGYSVWGAA